MRSVKRGRKLATATASLPWWECLKFRGEKTLLNAYVYAPFSYSFSFDPFLWWPLFLSMAAFKGLTRFHTSCLTSRIK